MDLSSCFASVAPAADVTVTASSGFHSTAAVACCSHSACAFWNSGVLVSSLRVSFPTSPAYACNCSGLSSATASTVNGVFSSTVRYADCTTRPLSSGSPYRVFCVAPTLPTAFSLIGTEPTAASADADTVNTPLVLSPITTGPLLTVTPAGRSSSVTVTSPLYPLSRTTSHHSFV